MKENEMVEEHVGYVYPGNQVEPSRFIREFGLENATWLSGPEVWTHETHPEVGMTGEWWAVTGVIAK